jgi:hypothetical protein
MYMAIRYVPEHLLSKQDDEKPEKRKIKYGIFGVFIILAVDVCAVFIVVLILHPIILSLSSHASWSFPWVLLTSDPRQSFAFVGAMMGVSLVLMFVPVVGQSGPFHTSVMGCIALVVALGVIQRSHGPIDASHVKLAPGWVGAIGLTLLAIGATYLGLIIGSIPMLIWYKKTAAWMFILMLEFASVLGFIPVFIYGAWLASQLKVGN